MIHLFDARSVGRFSPTESSYDAFSWKVHHMNAFSWKEIQLLISLHVPSRRMSGIFSFQFDDALPAPDVFDPLGVSHAWTFGTDPFVGADSWATPV